MSKPILSHTFSLFAQMAIAGITRYVQGVFCGFAKKDPLRYVTAFLHGSSPDGRQHHGYATIITLEKDNSVICKGAEANANAKADDKTWTVTCLADCGYVNPDAHHPEKTTKFEVVVLLTQVEIGELSFGLSLQRYVVSITGKHPWYHGTREFAEKVVLSMPTSGPCSIVQVNIRA